MPFICITNMSDVENQHPPGMENKNNNDSASDKNTGNERQVVTMKEYMDICANSITSGFLRKEMERPVRSPFQSYTDTEEQLTKHKINACVVTYLSNTEIMIVNPVIWAPKEYSISDVYEKDGIKFKIFVGDVD